ncbi:hypothetical protein T07_6747, partial [Trichinella nelsoni]
LYLTPLAFGAPTGGNAPCSNICLLFKLISVSQGVSKQDGIVEVPEETLTAVE